MAGEAATIFGVNRLRLVGDARERSAVNARFAVYHVSWEVFGFGTADIARAFGRADHSSVSHGIARARDMIQRDAEFASRTQLLLERAHELAAGRVILSASTAPSLTREDPRRRRVVNYFLAALERLAIDNPEGFDQLIARYSSYDPAHHL
jgi:hypothetical protein